MVTPGYSSGTRRDGLLSSSSEVARKAFMNPGTNATNVNVQTANIALVTPVRSCIQDRAIHTLSAVHAHATAREMQNFTRTET